MTDIEFIYIFSSKAGEHYEKSKSFASEVPEYALVNFRGFVDDLCTVIAAKAEHTIPKQLSKEQYRCIDYMRDKDLLDEESKDWLHELRKAGNKGAHPEKFYLSSSQYQDLITNSLQTACNLVKKLFPVIHGTDTPEYVWREIEDNTKLRDLCYASVIDSNSSSQYELGKILQSKAHTIRKQEIEEGEKNNQKIIMVEKSLKLYEKAFHWYQEAHHQHADAHYEYAQCLLHGLGVEINLEKAQYEFGNAAYRGSIDAKAAYGNLLFVGTEYVEQDYTKALELLEEAAQYDHPAALSDLGIAYHHGEGVKRDLQKSFEYIEKAAKAGYPNAQMNLSVYYLNGDVVDQNDTLGFEWLKLSADQGYPDAMVQLAEMYLQGRGCDRNPSKAQELYDDVCNLTLDLEAMFDAAMYYRDGSFGEKDLLQSAALLQRIYEHSDEKNAINRRAYNISPAIVKQLRPMLTQTSLSQESWTSHLLVSYLFDENGHPYKSRQERLAVFSEQLLNIANKASTNALSTADVRNNFYIPNTQQPQVRSIAKIGRNDLCTCGSGKKYKVCCYSRELSVTM